VRCGPPPSDPEAPDGTRPPPTAGPGARVPVVARLPSPDPAPFPAPFQARNRTRQEEFFVHRPA
jgi:hypothetical protein